MSEFSESGLIFSFPDDWVVRKFDASTAYQSLSGHGLKGVDFIALSPIGALWIIEVKNYHPRHARGQSFNVIRKTPQLLAEHVATKFRDSLRLLRIVHLSLRKRWWFRVWQYYRSRWPDPESNYWFWSAAYQRSVVPTAVHYVLWLETPENAADYGIAVRESLRSRFPLPGRLFVADTLTSAEVPFTVAFSKPGTQGQ